MLIRLVVSIGILLISISCSSGESFYNLESSSISKNILEEQDDLIHRITTYPISSNFILNETLKKKIDDNYSSFRRSLDDNLFDLLENGNHYIYKSSFIFTNNHDLFLDSFLLLSSWNEDISNSSNTKLESFIFSIKDASQISIIDLFKNPEEVYKKVHEYVTSIYIKDEELPEDLLGRLQATKDSYEFILVSNDGLLVVLEPIQSDFIESDIIQIKIAWDFLFPQQVYREFIDNGFLSNRLKREKLISTYK